MITPTDLEQLPTFLNARGIYLVKLEEVTSALLYWAEQLGNEGGVPAGEMLQRLRERRDSLVNEFEDDWNLVDILNMECS